MSMENFRRMAAEMDQRARQLAAEGVTGPALVDRMAGHMPDLQRIWVGTDDHQLAMLCQDYPGFYQYASVMEAAFEAERANPRFLHVPQLNDRLKPMLEALLTDAARLQRGYQVVIDVANRAVTGTALEELDQRYRDWIGDRERFVVALKEAGVPKIVFDVIGPGIGHLAGCIAQLAKRAAGAR